MAREQFRGPKWSYFVNFRCTGRSGPLSGPGRWGFSLSLTSLMDDPALPGQLWAARAGLRKRTLANMAGPGRSSKKNGWAWPCESALCCGLYLIAAVTHFPWICRVKCQTVSEASIPSDSRIDGVQFELDVAKLLQKCQCVRLMFSALQSDCE